MTLVNEQFYVTVRRGRRTGWLVGPFSSLAAAEPWISPAQLEAHRIDPWTHFDTFDITRVVWTGEGEPRQLPLGVLNQRVGYILEQPA